MIVDYRTYQTAAWLAEGGAILFLLATLAGISLWLVERVIGLLGKRRDRLKGASD
jgi:hypothetical protein